MEARMAFMMNNTPTRAARSFGFLALAMASALLPSLPATARAADAPAAKGASDAHQQMLKWFSKITFFGEEETGAWSLRIYDKDATERATIKCTELWKYDVDGKAWVKVNDGAPAAKIVLANEKPANSPPDTQVIADLPITANSVGLFYAKWRVNDSIDGATMTRIGPGLVGRAAKEAAENLAKPPEGYIYQVVPLSLNEAKLLTIPDPRKHTGQPAEKPTSRPSK